MYVKIGAACLIASLALLGISASQNSKQRRLAGGLDTLYKKAREEQQRQPLKDEGPTCNISANVVGWETRSKLTKTENNIKYIYHEVKPKGWSHKDKKRTYKLKGAEILDGGINGYSSGTLCIDEAMEYGAKDEIKVDVEHPKWGPAMVK